MAELLPGPKSRLDQDIERRLQLVIMNLCLAAVAGKKDDLRTCKGMLVREVARIIHDATNPHVKTAP